MSVIHNPLPTQARALLIALCQARLLDSLDLFHQANQAHWNVKGPSFLGLHTLFGEIVDASEAWADALAERLVQLGGVADGTIATTAAHTTMPAYPALITEQKDHLLALTTSLAAYAGRIREGIQTAEDIGDRDTADLLTDISRAVEKQIWFLEAHLG